MRISVTRSDRLVTIFGGSGFLGRHVAHALAQRGWRIRIAARRPDLAFYVQPSGRVGQIMRSRPICAIPNSLLPRSSMPMRSSISSASCASAARKVSRP